MCPLYFANDIGDEKHHILHNIPLYKSKAGRNAKNLVPEKTFAPYPGVCKFCH